MKFKITTPVIVAALAVTFAAGQALADPSPPSGGSGGYVAPRMTHASYGQLHVVVPLSSGDKMVQVMKLRNIANSLRAVEKWGGSLDVKVVLYARGVSLLTPMPYSIYNSKAVGGKPSCRAAASPCASERIL